MILCIVSNVFEYFSIFIYNVQLRLLQICVSCHMIAPPWAENTCQAKHENAIVVLCHGGWNCPGRCTAEKKQFFFWVDTVDGRNPAPVEFGSSSHYLPAFVHPKGGKRRISSVCRWKDERSSKYRSNKNAVHV